MTGLVAVLAVGHWLPAAKPITDRELLDGLGDPANAARRAKVTPELEKPDTIRWLFRVADSDDKRLRDRAAAWVTVWQANKPALTDEKLAAWGKAGELSRLVCATLEHKQRLKPITVKRGRNDPEPELPKGADLDPGVQLLAARDALIAAANKATGTKCDGRPLTYDGWDQGEELSEQLLPHLYSTAVKEYPDPFGRQRPNELNLCVESVSDAGLPGTPDARFLCTAVFGRGGLGKARGHGAD